MPVSGFPRGSLNYFRYHRWHWWGDFMYCKFVVGCMLLVIDTWVIMMIQCFHVREALGTVVGWKTNDPKGPQRYDTMLLSRRLITAISIIYNNMSFHHI